jgi:hypothetical protein
MNPSPVTSANVSARIERQNPRNVVMRRCTNSRTSSGEPGTLPRRNNRATLNVSLGTRSDIRARP